MLLVVFFLSLVLLAWPASAASASVRYCSSVNTGSDNTPDTNTYQSIGLCTQSCTKDYAFGILQGSSCWCSNVAPNESTNSDLSDCDDSCPGYPTDTCGNEEKGLFGYLALFDHKASSTAGASTQTGTSTDTATSAETSTTPAADSSVAVHTVAGKAQTVTVGPSGGTAVADTAATSTHSSGSGLSSGAVAGVAVGSVAGVGAILALVLVMICAKRRQNRNSRDSSMNNLMAEDRNSKGSIIKGFFYGTHSPTLSAGSSNTPQQALAFTDNRMKPGTMIYPNGNRDSSVSLQDNQDYSRPVLRTTNPD